MKFLQVSVSKNGAFITFRLGDGGNQQRHGAGRPDLHGCVRMAVCLKGPEGGAITGTPGEWAPCGHISSMLDRSLFSLAVQGAHQTAKDPEGCVFYVTPFSPDLCGKLFNI